MRNAFTMKLKKGFEAEYKKRHDEVWPELHAELKRAGVYDFTIFLDERSLMLFAVQNLRENNTAKELSKNPIMKKWWDYMADIIEVNPDNSPVCIPLKEVFHMD